MMLVTRLVRQFAIAFNTLLSVTFHVAAPSFFPSQFLLECVALVPKMEIHFSELRLIDPEVSHRAPRRCSGRQSSRNPGRDFKVTPPR